MHRTQFRGSGYARRMHHSRTSSHPSGCCDPDPDTHGEFQVSELGNFSCHCHRENTLALVQEGV